MDKSDKLFGKFLSVFESVYSAKTAFDVIKKTPVYFSNEASYINTFMDTLMFSFQYARVL